MALTVGSRVAYWNGISLGLGFEPRSQSGETLIHSLDVTKNLEPLLSGPTVFPTNRIVVLDPGHGGENTGTKSSIGNRFEKDLTLDWALRLRPLLEARGWTVVLTRTNDCDVPTLERIAVADRAQASLFISLHFNSVVSNHVSRLEHGGVETYCLTPMGMPSNLTREFEDDPRKSYPNNSFDGENLQYAIRLHRSILEATRQNDRGVRRARFMTVLQGQRRPAVLVEGGYLSLPDEARLIASAQYRQKLAEGIARALE
jgi:N-acetylmuramoyl-L-alanine amidase